MHPQELKQHCTIETQQLAPTICNKEKASTTMLISPNGGNYNKNLLLDPFNTSSKSLLECLDKNGKFDDNLYLHHGTACT